MNIHFVDAKPHTEGSRQKSAGCLVPIVGISVSIVVVVLVALLTWSIDSPAFWLLWAVFWFVVWRGAKRLERRIWG